MAEPYHITGVTTGVHPRREMGDLQKNYPIQWSLFIQATDKVHKMDEQKPNGWMQIGSIHGLPYTPWSGDPNGPRDPASNCWGGYCYHASALFPPWHRIMLLLLEQAIVQEASAIAEGLNNNEWKEEAKKLRFPYWDWTRAETAEEGIPTVCQQQKITILTADKKMVEVDNPLNHYKYVKSPGEAKDAKYMASWPRTFRWVKEEQRGDPKDEQYEKAKEAFAKKASIKVDTSSKELQPLDWLRAKVAELFTYDLTVSDPGYGGNMWGYFSSAGAASDMIYPVMDVMPPSLEEPHNQVHLHCGGDGSMSLNEYAGFDPIFFLHHCNVDRLYAFWEYLYPEYWLENGWVDGFTEGKKKPFITHDGTFFQEPGADVDNKTPCHPFRNQKSEYWTSEDARGLLSSNVNKYYTYPPIKDSRTGEQVDVGYAYNRNNLALRQRFQRILHNEFSPDHSDVVDHHAKLVTLSPDHADLIMRKEDDNTHLTQFFIVAELPEFAFSASYRLELYPLKNAEVQVINSVTVLGRADPERCAACVNRRAAGSVVRGYMPLDPRLIVHLIARIPPDQRSEVTELAHLADMLHESFGARIVRAQGDQLAAADPDVPASKPVLDQSKTPKLMLYSRIIQFNHMDFTEPIQFHSHTQHRDEVKMTWREF